MTSSIAPREQKVHPQLMLGLPGFDAPSLQQ
jgi:hypothetical protein